MAGVSFNSGVDIISYSVTLNMKQIRSLKMRLVSFVLALMVAPAAHAAGSISPAKDSQIAVMAFTCSNLAYMSGESKERAIALETIGIERARSFIEAAKDGKISEQDYHNDVPMYWQIIGGGPSTDFIVGKLSMNVSDYVVRDLYDNSKGKDGLPDQELIKLKAQAKYQEGNCRIL